MMSKLNLELILAAMNKNQIDSALERDGCQNWINTAKMVQKS